jgi:hypothetical protein
LLCMWFLFCLNFLCRLHSYSHGLPWNFYIHHQGRWCESVICRQLKATILSLSLSHTHTRTHAQWLVFFYEEKRKSWMTRNAACESEKETWFQELENKDSVDSYLHPLLRLENIKIIRTEPQTANSCN